MNRRIAGLFVLLMAFSLGLFALPPRIVQADVQPDIRATAQALAFATANAAVSVPLNFGMQMAHFQIVTGASVDASVRLIFENSTNGGTTWNGALVVQSSTGTGASVVMNGSIAAGSTFAPSATTTYDFWVPVGTATTTRVRVSTNHAGDSPATVAYDVSAVSYVPSVPLDTSGRPVLVIASLPPIPQPSPLYTQPVHDAAPVQPSPIYTVAAHDAAPVQPSPIYTQPVHDAAPVQPSPLYTIPVTTPAPVGTIGVVVQGTPSVNVNSYATYAPTPPAAAPTATALPSSASVAKTGAGVFLTAAFVNGDATNTTVWCGAYDATSITLGTTVPLLGYTSVTYQGGAYPIYPPPTIGGKFTTGLLFACSTQFLGNVYETNAKVMLNAWNF